jgi:hypothetical protein
VGPLERPEDATTLERGSDEVVLERGNAVPDAPASKRWGGAGTGRVITPTASHRTHCFVRERPVDDSPGVGAPVGVDLVG